MTTILNTHSGRDSVDGLPKQFLSSLRILFDILDENQTGYVRLRDIESRWSDDGVKGLPPGVVDGLRKVTPVNGLLTFDRFVAGLKLVLTKKLDNGPAMDTRRSFISKENRSPLETFEYDRSRSVSNELITNRYGGSAKLQSSFYRQQSNHIPAHKASVLNEANPFSSHQTNDKHRREPRQAPYRVEGIYSTKPEPKNTGNYIVSNTAVNTAIAGTSNSGNGNNTRHYTNNNSYKTSEQPPLLPPRKDQRSRADSSSFQIRKSLSGPNLQMHSSSPPVIPPRDAQSSTRILNELKSWQREWSAVQSSDKPHTKEKYDRVSYGPDGMIYANIEDFQKRSDELQPAPRNTVRRHGSGRRHTLANGIDHNMLKRMKQLEEEMSVLREGLTMIDTAREWYLKQIQAISDKQAMLDKVKFNDNSVDAHQEKMNFQRARITEVSQHLRTLIESSDKGFPLHMNLAVSGINSSVLSNQPAVQNLKEQNRNLIEELNQKKEHISQLEKEKSTLVRELFEARSKNKSSFDDTTFM
ncbi:hypothetical protein Btru_013526 [Bulinus truncatus]|nr:hypothetical protein Btru_013526 [Bulinus truncatus]